MRSKVKYDLLARSQKYSKFLGHPIQRLLYETVYKHIVQMRSDIIKPFSNICIHGNFPELIIPSLTDSTKNQQKSANNIWIHSHVANLEQISQIADSNIKILDENIAYNAIPKEQKGYDLIVSCLVGHHYDINKLMENYVQRLSPDGAVIGCCWAQNTLKQLNWAYLMAQNQRSGGVSPKIIQFPSLGTIGHAMTSSNIKMPTIVVRDMEIEVDSVVDILTLLQTMGQSGIMQGKRKGTFKDVLLAMSAFYQSQFSKREKDQQKKSVNFSLELGLFVGWKQHESQPKPLSRKQVINNSFFSELMKNDETSKMYVIKEGNDEPEQVTKNTNPQITPEDPQQKTPKQ